MSYINYKEDIKRGSVNFPFEYYDVSYKHPRYTMKHHWHTEYEIVHVISGEFELSVDDNVCILRKGESALIGSGMLHGGYPKNCHYQSLVFDMAKIVNDNPMCQDDLRSFINTNSFIYAYFSNKQEDMSKIISSILSPFEDTKSGYKLSVMSAFLKLLSSLIANPSYYSRFYITSSNQKKILKLKNALQYIASNYQDKISLEEIAEQTGMNTNYFCKVFKEVTRRSPMDYLNFFRVEKAAEKLMSGHSNVTEVAMQCGFNDISYFVKVFKKYKGMTPGGFTS